MTINKTNYRKYPLEFLNNVYPIIADLRQIAKEYSNIIVEVNLDSDIIRFTDRIQNSEFYFFLIPNEAAVNAGLNDTVRVFFYPGNEKRNQHMESVMKLEDIPYAFKSWISFILSYNKHEVKFSPEEKIQKIYEEEFKAGVTILDPNADTEPFENDRQKTIFLILSYLEVAIDSLPNKSEKVVEIIREISEFKEEIPSLTKTETISKGSKIFAKLKKLGQTAINKIIDKLIELGINKIMDGSVMRFIENYHNHLPF